MNEAALFLIERLKSLVRLAGRKILRTSPGPLPTEDMLERQTEFLNAVLENVRDGVVACDADGKLTVFNQATRQMHGLDARTDIPPERWSEHYRLFQADGVTPIKTEDIPLRRAFMGEHVRNAKLIIESNNGRRSITLCNGQAIYDKNGRKIGAVITMNDMTEITRAHEELVETNHALQSALAAKSEFLANMSHEIRTPLNGVLGMTELVLSSHLTTEQRQQLEVVHSSAESLLTIISDILDFSKIEAQKLEIENVVFDLQKLSADVHEMLSVTASRKGLMLTNRVDLTGNSFFTGDPGRIRQVLLNLVSNALKFTEHGSVDVKIACGPSLHGRTPIRFEVRDQGVGISPSVLSRLFQPFSQADSSTTRRFGGTGLGLSISKKLVELMGGRIGVQSQPGTGSTFWFEVELAEAAPQELRLVDEVAKNPAPSRPLRILLAEDNPVNQKIALAMLAKLGHQANVVENGLAALEALADEKYDIVLMDCQMPVMDGYETTRIIRANPSVYAGLKVIALTANAMKGDREQCLNIGMDDYISKPLALDALKKALARQAC